MTRYKIDYSETPHLKTVRKRNRRWVANLVAGVLILTFSLLFFGGLGTAFRYRGQHHSLREQHDALRLRYDSLYAAKLEADRKLAEVQKQLQLLRRPAPHF